MAGKRIDLTGQKFGRLIALKRIRTKQLTWWLCKCECGNEVVVRMHSLRSKNNTKSCGCLHKEISRELCIKQSTKHGLYHTRFYKIWGAMKSRVLNLNYKQAKDYSGRGITICKRWLKFENFRDDMLKRYDDHVAKFGEKQTTIDRIDNNGNYTPDNCRWATWKEQLNNTSRNIAGRKHIL